MKKVQAFSSLCLNFWELLRIKNLFTAKIYHLSDTTSVFKECKSTVFSVIFLYHPQKNYLVAKSFALNKNLLLKIDYKIV